MINTYLLVISSTHIINWEKDTNNNTNNTDQKIDLNEISFDNSLIEENSTKDLTEKDEDYKAYEDSIVIMSLPDQLKEQNITLKNKTKNLKQKYNDLKKAHEQEINTLTRDFLNKLEQAQKEINEKSRILEFKVSEIRKLSDQINYFQNELRLINIQNSKTQHDLNNEIFHLKSEISIKMKEQEQLTELQNSKEEEIKNLNLTLLEKSSLYRSDMHKKQIEIEQKESNINNLKDNIEEDQHKITDLNNQIQKLENELELLIEKNKTTSLQFQTNIDVLSKQIKLMEEEKADLVKQNQLKDKEIGRLSNIIEESVVKFNNQLKELSAFKIQFSELEKKHSELQHSNSDTNKKFSESRSENISLSRQIDENKTQISNLTQTKESLTNQVDKLKKELHLTNQSNATSQKSLNDNINILKKQLEEQVKINKNLDVNIQNLQQNIKNLEQNIQDSLISINKKNEEIQILNTTVSKKDEDIDALKYNISNQLESYTKNLDALNNGQVKLIQEHDTKISQMNTTITQKNQFIQEQEQKIKILSGDYQKTLTNLQNKTKEKDTLENAKNNEIKSLKESYTNLEIAKNNEINSLKQNLINLENSKNNLIQTLKTDIANLTRDKNKIISDLQQTINDKIAIILVKDKEIQQCNEAINNANNFLAHTKKIPDINLGKWGRMKKFKD